MVNKLRGVARKCVRQSVAHAIDEEIVEAFFCLWPRLRRACLAGRPLDEVTLAELWSVAHRLGGLGLSRSGMMDITRAMVEAAEREIAAVERELSAARALRFSRYILVTVHEVVSALLGSPEAVGGAAPAARADGEDDVSGLEREILRRLAYGQSSSEIAGELHYSKQAVSYHLSRLLTKYHVPNRTALVAMAYENGLLPVRVADSRLRAS